MRTLVDAARFDRPGFERQWQRFLRRTGFHALMPDLLVRGRFALALDGLVLSQADLGEIERIAERFGRLLELAADRIAGDTAELERIGFPWVAAELLAQEPVAPIVIGRLDLVRDEAGRWWVLEYNSDTPSGIREAVVADAIVHDWLGAGTRRPNERLAPAVLETVTRLLGNGPGCLGIVTDGGEPEDLAQMEYTRRLLAPALAGSGWQTVLGDVTNLTLKRRTLHLLGQPLAALYRYYPFESMLGSRGFHDIFEAVFAGRLRLLNGLRGFLPQNKAVAAWLWSHRDDPAITAEDRTLIERHLPETYWIRDLPPDFDYRDWVLKQVFGREGAEVYFGDTLDPLDWLRCRNWGTFVVQRRIRTQAVTAIGWDGFRAALMPRYPTVGAYLVNGRFAGFYSRLGDRITSNTALWYGTYVEGD